MQQQQGYARYPASEQQRPQQQQDGHRYSAPNRAIYGPGAEGAPSRPQQQRQSSYGMPPGSPLASDPRRVNGSSTSTSRNNSPAPPSPVGGPGGPAGGRPFPPNSRHSPAPSASNASFHTRDPSSTPSRPSSQIPPSSSSRSLLAQSGSGQPPQTIAGEPLHDLSRAVALLKSSKFYAEGG